MRLEKYIQSELPILHLGDDTKSTLLLLEDLDILPLLSEDRYIGLLSYTDVAKYNQASLESEDFHHLINHSPAIKESSHPLEAIRLLSQIHSDYLPVIDTNGNYLGHWNATSSQLYLEDSHASQTEGAIITLLIEPRNYSLSEISRLCETNDVKILGLEIHDTINEGMLEVSIKVNQSNIAALLSTFQRYGYYIEQITSNLPLDDKLKDNYDALMAYLAV